MITKGEGVKRDKLGVIRITDAYYYMYMTLNLKLNHFIPETNTTL